MVSTEECGLWCGIVQGFSLQARPCFRWVLWQLFRIASVMRKMRTNHSFYFFLTFKTVWKLFKTRLLRVELHWRVPGQVPGKGQRIGGAAHQRPVGRFLPCQVLEWYEYSCDHQVNFRMKWFLDNKKLDQYNLQFLKRTKKWVRQIFWVSFAIMACQFRKGFYLFLFGKSTWIIWVSFDVWNSPLGSQFQAYALLAISSISFACNFKHMRQWCVLLCIAY